MTTTAFDLDHFTYRVLRDAMNNALPAYWRRRAADFRRTFPRDDDFTGQATPADVERRRRRVEKIVQACEQHTTVCTLSAEEEALLLDELDHCRLVATFMREADDATTLEEIRSVWRLASSIGHLDEQLARHLERQAKSFEREAEREARRTGQEADAA